MNNFSEFWKALVDNLNANKASLDIDGAERAATGKVTTLSPPSAAVWLNPITANVFSQDGALFFPLDIYIYCIASPKTSESDSVDAALSIAVKILKHLSNAVIGGVQITQPENEPAFEIVERSSNAAIVGVLLKAEITL